MMANSLTVRAWFRLQRAQLFRTAGFQMELIYLGDAISSRNEEMARIYMDWLITRTPYQYGQIERNNSDFWWRA